MQQVTQKLSKGHVEIRDVPLPMLPPGHIIVRNHFSLISAGTEGSTVATARRSLVGKARARPQQARQVIDVLRTQGVVQTYRTVVKKLDAYSPLGYSCAGEVVEVAPDVREFNIGDLVACAGNTANHAECVAVPINLATRLSPSANLQAAAFSALGAIAMQGIRRSSLSLGESCAVIGLGLIGQLTGKMLKASGVQVFGIDIDPAIVKATSSDNFDQVWARDTPGLAEKIEELTLGLGVDSVIITAGTSSLDPINFAGRVCRKRGSVVVVGAVPTGFDRDPYFYRKELDLRMSCSYGPGRYDPVFEDKGIDYPAAYVRWTEKRNMQAFNLLIESGQIDVNELVTHQFDFSKVADAYELILERVEPYFGVILSYDTTKPMGARLPKESPRPSSTGLGISFIGAGSYAQSYLLPNIRKVSDINLRGVITNSGTTSQRVADQYGFDFAGDDTQAVLNDPSTSTVFITTRHNTHGSYVAQALKAGKHVYVEKPLCLSTDELTEIVGTYRSVNCHLMIGFNRRFAPHIVTLKSTLRSETPMSVMYRVNAGAIPPDSWIQDMSVGGGRIVGEACHFIDLIGHLTASLPVRVYTSAMRSALNVEDTVSINIEFENGSIGTVHYFANGEKSMPKEYIEVYQDGCSYKVEDFKSLYTFISGKTNRLIKSTVQNKGQSEMVDQFVNRIRSGGQPLVSFNELYSTMAATLGAVASLRNHAPVEIVPLTNL